MTNFNLQTKNVVNGFVFLAVSALLGACGGAPQQMPPAQMVNADFLEITPTTSVIQKKYPGQIEGTVNVAIKAQVSGYLDQIYVKEGDFVQKGASLFRIKSDVYDAQVSNNQAAVKAALAAQESAQIELEKIKPLVEGKVVSEVQLKTAQASYEAATAQVAQAKAGLNSSRINAGFALIKAPVSGYIGRIPNRIGNLVTPADMTPLTTLSDISNVFVYFSMSEADYISFMKEQKTSSVQLILADGSQYKHDGQLETASGNIDRQTGSIAFKAVFPNPDKLLRSGGSARVVLSKTLAGSLAVPMASVKDIQDRHFVFVLGDSNKVSMRPLEISGSSANDYVVNGGLKAGEKIALNSIDALNEGMKVVPKVTRQKPVNK